MLVMEPSVVSANAPIINGWQLQRAAAAAAIDVWPTRGSKRPCSNATSWSCTMAASMRVGADGTKALTMMRNATIKAPTHCHFYAVPAVHRSRNSWNTAPVITAKSYGMVMNGRLVIIRPGLPLYVKQNAGTSERGQGANAACAPQCPSTPQPWCSATDPAADPPPGDQPVRQHRQDHQPQRESGLA